MSKMEVSKDLLFWLLCWLGLSVFIFFWFGFHARVNSMGDGLCDKCGAPATWGHFEENRLVGEFCEVHRFYGTPYLGTIVGGILFLATIGVTIITYVITISKNLKSATLKALFIVSVLAVWFHFQSQYCYTIQQPDLVYTLGLSVFLLIIQLGAVIGGLKESFFDARARQR